MKKDRSWLLQEATKHTVNKILPIYNVDKVHAFIAAYDAWHKYVAGFKWDFDSMSYQELGQMDKLQTAMEKARAEMKD